MDGAKPSYEELKTRLAAVEAMLEAISSDSVDALIGEQGVYLLRLHEVEKALRESEQKFRTAFANAAVGFALTTPDGRFVDSNSAYSLITGYDIEDLKALDLQQLIHPDDLAETMKLIDRMLAGGIPDLIIENRYVRQDGESVWVRNSVSLVRNEEGGPRWIIALAEDVTEQRRLEDALRVSNQDLTDYSHALTHNLKEPLRAIHNYVDFLLEDLADTLEGEPKRYLEGIKKSLIKSHQQFQDLEALYSIKNHPLNLETFEMKELIDEIQLMFKGTGDRQLIAQGNWPVLKGERHLLRQILINWIRNGFKYNDADLKKVEIGWRQAADHRIEIFVRDNGIGIEPRFHEGIFRIFKRLHTDCDYGGTGIGLAIVKRAAQKIGGSLRVESTLGEGSTFYLGLPESIIDRAHP